MNKMAITAMAVLWSMSASAVEGKVLTQVISDKVALTPKQWFRLDADKGEVKIVPGENGLVTYEVEFTPNRWSKPTAQDFKDSTAIYSAGMLTVRCAQSLNVKVSLRVPPTQRVEALLESGVMSIGPITGELVAKVQTGTLDYDARALPADVCVNATVNVGTVENHRDFRCKPGQTTLHVRTGTLEVN